MPAFWERRFLRNEFWLVTVCTAALAIWGYASGGSSHLAGVFDGNRSTLYATGASISAALLGFLMATVAIVQGMVRGPGFAALRDHEQYPTFWAVFRWTIRTLAVSCGFFLLALALDRDSHPYWPALYLSIWALLLSGVRLARSIWILDRVLRIASLVDRP